MLRSNLRPNGRFLCIFNAVVRLPVSHVLLLSLLVVFLQVD